MKMASDEIVSVLREEISNFDNKTRRAETGTILNVGDGIATIYGLNSAFTVSWWNLKPAFAAW